MSKIVPSTEGKESFTPGPWQIVPATDHMPAYICTDPNKHMETEIAVIYGRKDEKANARLIAAAPQMFAALKRLYPLLADKGMREEIGALLNEIEL